MQERIDHHAQERGDVTAAEPVSRLQALPQHPRAPAVSRGCWLIVAVALALRATAGAAAACDSAPPKNGVLTVMAVGFQRRAIVHLPRAYDGKTLSSIVIAFHGFGQDVYGAAEMFAVEKAWSEAIAVYPEALERHYPGFPGNRAAEFRGAVGRGWQVEEKELGDRDVAFFDALREELMRRFCGDQRKVYVIGFSNGAYFANLLGCVRPEIVAGIAAAGGGMRCKPKGPVAVMLFHGARDPIVDFSESIDAERAWGHQNGCEAVSSETPALRCVPLQECTRAEVVLCADGGGHHYERSFTEQAVEVFRRKSVARPHERNS